MANNKKPRKKYNPNKRQARVAGVIDYPFTQEEERKLIEPPHEALARLRNGTGQEADIWTLWYRIRVTIPLLTEYLKLSDGGDEAIAALAEAEPKVRQFLFAVALAESTNILVDKDLGDLIDVCIDIADQAQGMVNRLYQRKVHVFEYDECVRLYGEMAKGTHLER